MLVGSILTRSSAGIVIGVVELALGYLLYRAQRRSAEPFRDQSIDHRVTDRYPLPPRSGTPNHRMCTRREHRRCERRRVDERFRMHSWLGLRLPARGRGLRDDESP